MEEDLREFEQTLGVKLGTRVFVELPKDGNSDDNNKGFISSIDGEKTDSMSISEIFAKMNNAEVVCYFVADCDKFWRQIFIHVTDNALTILLSNYLKTILRLKSNWFQEIL